MPANGTPFLLEVCSSGLQMPASGPHAQHHHADQGQAGHLHAAGSHGAHTDFDQCPFGSAPAAGPPTQPAAYVPPAFIDGPVVDPEHFVRLAIRTNRAHRARAPPYFA